MGRNGPKCDSRKPKSQLSCLKAACISELYYPAIPLDYQATKNTTFIQTNSIHVCVYNAAVNIIQSQYAGSTADKLPEDPLPSAVCCCRLLHPELSPRWSVCERGPRQPPWLTRQTRPAGRRPPGPKGHTQLLATSYGRRSSGGVESDPPHPWAGSSSSTLLWMVRSSCVLHITACSLLQTRHWFSLVYKSDSKELLVFILVIQI